MRKLLVGRSDGGSGTRPLVYPAVAGRRAPMPPWGRFARYHTILDPLFRA